MLKSGFKLITLAFFVFQLGYAAIYNYDALAVPTPQIWADGDVVYINTNVEFQAEVTASGYVQIEINEGNTVTFKDNLYMVGKKSQPININVKNSTGSNKFNSMVVDTGVVATIQYVNLQNADWGMSLNSDDIWMDKANITDCTNRGLTLSGSAPYITRSRFLNCGSYTIYVNYSTIQPSRYPIFQQNSIADGGVANIVVRSAAWNGTMRFENNYWGGGTANILNSESNPNLSFDSMPMLSNDPFSTGTIGSKTNISSGSGTDGQIDDPFYLFENRYFQLFGGGLLVTGNGKLYLGVTSNIRESALTFEGGTFLQIDNNSWGITVSNNGHFISGGSGASNVIEKDIGTTAGGWEGLTFQAGSKVTLNNLTIKNAVTGIIIEGTDFVSSLVTINYCTTGIALGNIALPTVPNISIINCTNGLQIDGYNNNVRALYFGSNTNRNILVNSGTPSIFDCDIIGGVVGIELKSNALVTNNRISNSNSLIYVSNSNPIIRYNTLTCGAAGTRGIYLGGALNPTIENNNIINCDSSIYNNASVVVTAENNWFGSNPPDASKFNGSGEIDYEPWLDALYPGGVGAQSPPATVSATTITPTDGSLLDNAPSALNFSTYDAGYYGDNPLEFRVQIADNNLFVPTLIDKYSRDGSGSGFGDFANTNNINFQTVTYNLTGGSLTPGATYYWRIMGKDRHGTDSWSVWSPTFNFSISKPDVSIVLSSSVARASAGEIVEYTLVYQNNEALGSVKNNEIIFALPEEVMANGTVQITVPNGRSVTVNAYDDLTGLSVIGQGSYIADGNSYTVTNVAGWNDNNLDVSENPQVLRYGVVVDEIFNGQNGTIKIETLVR